MKQNKKYDGFIYCPYFDPKIEFPGQDIVFTTDRGKKYIFVPLKFMLHIIDDQDQLNSFWNFAKNLEHSN